MNLSTRLVPLAALITLAGITSNAQAGVSLCRNINSNGTAVSENFDTLAQSGTTNALSITGWSMTETGGGARDNEQYAGDNGGSNTGDTYSYGTTAASDRALGGLRSGTLQPVFGTCLQNSTGGSITSLAISYRGEQWRLGTASRSDQLDFQYSTDATSLTTGTWIDVNSLDFVTPNQASVGAKDGNLAGNFTVVSDTIGSLTIANGANVWLRWNDLDATGADDGLSVDDFSVTSQGAGGSAADLLITQTDSPDPATAGGNLVYTITATNDGPSPATAALISGTLPAGTTFVSLPVVAGWTCITPAVGAGGAISCSNPSFAVGSDVFTLTTLVDPATASGTSIVNTVLIESMTLDPAPANNSGFATTTIATAADISITKTAQPEPVSAGGNITYTITASNAGTSNAGMATMIDNLPAGTTFVSLASPGTWTCTTPAVGASGTINCSNASMIAGADVFTVVVQVGASVAGGTVISNTATIASTTTDPNPGNESATANTTVVAPSSVSGTKTASGNFQSGGSVTYTITLTNSGANAQTDNAGNEFTDVLPAGMSLVSASASSGTAVANVGTDTVTWNGAIAAGGNVVITINALIDANLASGVTLVNQGTISYDGDGNGTNEATASTDDPGTGAAADGTAITITAGAATAIPLSSAWMNLLLMATLAMAATLVMRRRLR